MGDTVDSLQPLPISWNSSCITDTTLDIYLISPTSEHPRIHLWENVPNSAGTYTADLMPRWWNATSSQQLQFSIVPHSKAVFTSNVFAPPVFTATYTQPSSGMPASADTSVIDSGVTEAGTAPKKSNGGKTAAAVILPLLFVALCIGVYIKMKRTKGKEARKRWTQTLDERMSTISTDWKSVSGAGANAAIRNSMAVGNRNSSFSFGAIRPSSTYAVEGEDAGSAGIGARQMSQMRTGVGLRNPTGTATNTAERVSRVSFAPDTRVSRVSFADSRPSGESRRTRAFHSAYIPPVPALPDQANDDDNVSEEATAQFSPRQTQGPIALSPEDIRSRATGNKKESDLADFMPALSMMRTGGPQESDDYLFPTPPTPPTPTHQKLTPTPHTMSSPVMPTMPMQPMPASVMSPDEMLRAYAKDKKSMAAGGAAAGVISYPVPAANASTPVPSVNNAAVGSSGMRVLYNATGSSATTAGASTYASSEEYYAVNAYGGAEGYQQPQGHQNQYAFGHHPNASIGVGAYGGAQYAIGDDDHEEAYSGHAA
ncbi:hypothetical protein BDN70DRAFT_876305 [Pholiota conissans]|uniref:Uncharacterized protein n=1 Tax=Pholiota conissans TaxID=109636 RepID=A0A9P6CW69_9AGAR|nr:hypothetical protein BDN70DRAFT_876305 [Pholiota conissans]